MEKRILRTVDWSDCVALLTILEMKYFGKPKRQKNSNFEEFIKSFTTNRKQMDVFLAKNVNRHIFADYTERTKAIEDACLFSQAPALDIICRHLRALDSGKELPTLWCFLDEERKAVVHFIYREGWYAEAYFTCDTDFSVLHLLEGEDEATFIPVVFSDDIARYVALAERGGSYLLQTYLPRESFQLLSKRGGKNKDKKKDALSSGRSSLVQQKDRDDML